MSGSGNSPKSIFYIVDDYMACGWYRAHVPGMELHRRGYEVVLDHQISAEQIERFDVIVFQRQWQQAAIGAMYHAKSLGKTVVYELDDDLWNVHPSNPAYDAWQKPEVIGGAEQLIRSAHVVTTTTDAMVKQLRRFNPKIRILPNMLPSERWQARRERQADYDKVVLGWAGSVARQRDLEIVKNVVPQLVDRYPNVEMLVAGHPENLSVFPTHPRITNTPPVPIEQYAETLTRFDIGLAPVVDSRFNQAKSDLKVVEYGMVGVPTVASNVEAYLHTIVNGEFGFRARNDKDWLKYLQRLIENPQLRDEMGAKAKAFAESRTIERNIGLWERAYGLTGQEKAAS